MGPKSKALFPFVLVTMAGLLLSAACGKGERQSSAEKKTTLAVIPMGTTHEFWKAIHAGALTAARELNVEIIPTPA